MRTIGERIKTLRVLYWITQFEFARRVGVSRRQVSYWEAGEDTPSADRIPRICEVMGVSPTWLLTGYKLKDVYDASRADKNRAAHEKRGLQLQARLLHRLPSASDLEKDAQVEWVDVLPDDAGSLIVRINNDSMAPTFCSGDQIFFRTVQIVLPAPLPEMAKLHDRHVAATVNGESTLWHLEVAPESKTRCTTRLLPIRGKSAAAHTVRHDDKVGIHGVAYKCVRAL